MRKILAAAGMWMILATTIWAAPPGDGSSKSSDRPNPRSRRAAAGQEQPDPEPVPGYKYREILDFKLLIHKDVLEENKKSTDRRKPLEVLELEFGMLARELPPRAVKVLREEIGFWVEWDKEKALNQGAGRAVACYHPGPGSDRRRKYSFSSVEAKMKSNSVEILSMMSLTAEHQGDRHRCVLLHEITHAVHHHLFDYGNPQIIATYKNAMSKGLYAGQYAATNEKEYFAEITCAYFSHLNYQPHDRQELKQYDPAGYDMMEKVWGTPEAIAAEIRVVLEQEAAPKLALARRLVASKTKASEGIAALESIVKNYPDTKAAATAKRLLDKHAPAAADRDN